MTSSYQFIEEHVRLDSEDETLVRVSLTIPQDLPHLAGHFPGHPVVPAIVLMEINERLLQRYRPIATESPWTITKSKFISTVAPDQPYRVEIKSDSGPLPYRVTWFDEQSQQVAFFHYQVEEADQR